MDKKEMRNLFDGDCSPAEEQIAGRWLAEHAETKEADELLYALLRETKPATADAEGAFRRVCRRLGIAPKSSAWRLVGRWTMRAAACLLLPVAALAFYLYGEAQRPGEWFEAYAPYGKTLRVVLPDGSEVVINSGSKLIYPDRFGPDRRQVFLAGEGYATIAKDPGRPFVMSAGEVDVRVLGTKFNVVAEEENGLFSTALFEGRVAVSSRLVPGERLVLEPDEVVTLEGKHLCLGQIDNDEEYLWTNGIISLTDQSFSELMHRFEKTFGVTIRIEREPSIRIGQGKIRQSVGIDNALQVLQRFADFEYEKDEQNNTITIR